MAATEGTAHLGNEVVGDVVASDPGSCASPQRGHAVRGVGFLADDHYPVAAVSVQFAAAEAGKVDAVND